MQTRAKHHVLKAIIIRSLSMLLAIGLSYGNSAFAAEDHYEITGTSNTNQECRELAEKTLELSDTDRQRNIPGLISCLEHEYFARPGAAKYVLSTIGEPALPALIMSLDSPNYYVVTGSAVVLGMIGPTANEAVPALKKLLRTKTESRSSYAGDVATALGQIGEIDFLIRALQGEEPGVGLHGASIGLRDSGPLEEKWVPVLLQIINSDKTYLHSGAAMVLGSMGETAAAAIPRLEELTKGKHSYTRRVAGEALVSIGTKESQEAASMYSFKKGLFEGFYEAMSIFAWCPVLALIAGLGIGTTTYLVNRRYRAGFSGWSYTPALLWLIYAAWEFYARLSGANIRIDLLAIYPILVTTTIIWIVVLIIGSVKAGKRGQVARVSNP